jgi:type IV pilus assembly protein PilM
MNMKQEISFSDVTRLLSRGRSKGGGAAPKRRRVEQTPKDLVGLEAGASKLAAAHVVNNGVAELRQLASAPLPSGVVVNGELRDVDGFAAALIDFFRTNELPTSAVRLGIANSRIGVRSFEITGVEDERQLENAIRFRAQDLLPIPLDEAVMDHQVLERRQDDSGATTWRVLLVVAHRALIEGYLTACTRAGIRLAGVDLEAFGLLRALRSPVAEGAVPAALVAVSIGHDRTTLAVSDGQVCEFARVLEWGGDKLDGTIAKMLSIQKPEAEALKRTLDLTPPTTDGNGAAADGDPRLQKALASVRDQLQIFARELISSLQFYQAQPGSLPIGEIQLTGGTAALPGLAGELTRLTRVNVRLGDPLARVQVAPSVNPVEPVGAVAVAIGLGIEE